MAASVRNLLPMKETWIHGGKCGTMRVITAALRNGGAAAASGGPGPGREQLPPGFLVDFLVVPREQE
jgi:hypothetical protein